jgi:glycerophosphoryl diester phosphodiesterase
VAVRPVGHNDGVTSEDRDLRQTWLMRTPIAHRGLHAAADGRPENSLAAFAHACALGFPAEMDVRLTRDGEVVVFHDRALQRLTGASGIVEERTAAELRGLRLLGTAEPVPLLRDVLDLVAGRVPLLIELKPSAPGPELEHAVVEALAGYEGEVAISSFHRRALRALDRAGAPQAVGQLSRWRPVPAVGVRPAFLGRHVASAPLRVASPRRGAGPVVLAWTVRSAEQARRALRFVDNYIFEGFVPVPADAHRVSGPRSAPGAAR